MMFANGVGRHPTDGDLLRDLDGELSDLEHRRLRKHLEECLDCDSRINLLKEHSAVVQSFLSPSGGMDVEPDDLSRARALGAMRAAQRAAAGRRSMARRRLTVAAAAAGLVVGLSSVSPLRAWVRDLIRAEAPTEPGRSLPVASLPVTVVGGNGSLITFQPTQTSFELRLEHRQEAGSLAIRIGDGVLATAHTAGAADESIMVLPQGMRIENGPGSTASYRVTLPATLKTVRVVVGRQMIATIPVSTGAGPIDRVIPLGGGVSP